MLNKSVRNEGELQLTSKLRFLALIVIVIGVIWLVIGEVNLANTTQTEVGTRQYDVWSAAVNLTSGSTYRVDISGNNWGAAFASGGFTTAQPLNVTITSPGGGISTLQAFYWGEPSSGMSRGGTPPTIITVTFLSVDDAGLSAGSSLSEIVFTARQTGLYNVSIPQKGGLFYTSKQPADYIDFYEYVTPNRETYSLITAGGGGAAALGGVAFIVSLFRRQSVKRKRTAK
jgi:hypothetical protein